MKKVFLILPLMLLIAMPLISFGQTEETKSFNPHYSLIIGLGSSIIANTIYQNPAINNMNNAVIIEKADKLRYTATLGFSYTPYIWAIPSVDTNGKPIMLYKPKGWTVAVFANPLSMSTITGNTTSFDWGAGVGWRFVGMSLLATVEFFTVRQPKDYFIKSFTTNDKPYLIDNNIQKELATTDDNVFRSKAMIAFGAKLVIPIDVLKSLK